MIYTQAEKFAKLNGIKYDDYIDEPSFNDAKSILEVMMKREDWCDFKNLIGGWSYCEGDVSKIELDYILNPDKLLDEAVKWCEENSLEVKEGI